MCNSVPRIPNSRFYKGGDVRIFPLLSTKFSSNNNVAKPRLAIGSNYNFPNLAGLSRYLANSRDRCNPGELQLTYRDNRRVSLSSLAIEKGIRCKISRIKKKWSNRKLNRQYPLQFNLPIMRHYISCNNRFIQYPRF